MFIKNRFRFTNDRCKKRKWKMTTETIKTKQRKTRKQNWKEMGKLSWTLTDTWFFIRTAISIMNINFQFRKYETKIKNKKKIYSLADEMLNYRLGVWLRLFVYIYWNKKISHWYFICFHWTSQSSFLVGLLNAHCLWPQKHIRRNYQLH